MTRSMQIMLAVVAVAASTGLALNEASAAPRKVKVPAGTRLLVRMDQSVDSRHQQVGDRFRAILETNLQVNGRTVVSKGARVFGRLVEAKQAGRVAGRAELRLELTDLEIAGTLHPIVTSDYEVSGKSSTTDTAKKTAAGAVVGAIIGGIAGGGDGAATGAAIGGSAGFGAAVLTKGSQVRIPAETLIEFRLERQATLPAWR